MNGATQQDVIGTLVLALTQTQALLKTCGEQQQLITRLKNENEALQQELEQLRPRSIHNGTAAQMNAQVEQMFVREAEKQAEIDRLRKSIQILQAKEKKWKKKHPQSSSPLILSEDLDVYSSSPLLRPAMPGPVVKAELCQSSRPTTPNSNTPGRSPALKRKREDDSESTNALREIDINERPQQNEKQLVKPRDISEKSIATIPLITEDGEVFGDGKAISPKPNKSSELHGPNLYHRLEGLLSTPSPVHTVLSKKETRVARPLNLVAAHPPSQGAETKDEQQHPTASRPSEPKRPRFLPPNPRAQRGPEDEEPLRARPLNRLNLSHFKLNPLSNSGLDYAFNETIRGKDQRKCLPGCTRSECCGSKFRAVATTLGVEKNISEDEILLEFLGPGSEEKIRAMTTTARENLLHEAWARKLANEYGKMHRNAHERAHSPVDFWNADMPSTQEGRDIQEHARLREREEVERRYLEACKDVGLWMFADE